MLVAVATRDVSWAFMGLAGMVGTFLAVRSGAAHKLTISADGLDFGPRFVPWSDFERLEHRPLLGPCLVLARPITWPRWYSLWKTKRIGLWAYGDHMRLGADLARWAPHLLEDRALARG